MVKVNQYIYPINVSSIIPNNPFLLVPLKSLYPVSHSFNGVVSSGSEEKSSSDILSYSVFKGIPGNGSLVVSDLDKSDTMSEQYVY